MVADGQGMPPRLLKLVASLYVEAPLACVHQGRCQMQSCNTCHAMYSDDEATKGVLIDVKSALRVYCAATLDNIQVLCPSLAPALVFFNTLWCPHWWQEITTCTTIPSGWPWYCQSHSLIWGVCWFTASFWSPAINVTLWAECCRRHDTVRLCKITASHLGTVCSRLPTPPNHWYWKFWMPRSFTLYPQTEPKHMN